MKKVEKIFDELFIRYPVLESCRTDIWNAYEYLKHAIRMMASS